MEGTFSVLKTGKTVWELIADLQERAKDGSPEGDEVGEGHVGPAGEALTLQGCHVEAALPRSDAAAAVVPPPSLSEYRASSSYAPSVPM